MAIRSLVHPPFCLHFQTTSSPKMLSQFCSNFIWSLLRLGEQKIAKMVAVCLRWPPCPYIVKTFKNLLLQNRGCLGAESLHKPLRIGGLPVAKMMVLHWCLTFFTAGKVCFPMHLYGPIHLYGKNEFQTTSPLKPLGQCCSNFKCSLLGAGEWKIVKIVTVRLPRWPPCP